MDNTERDKSINNTVAYNTWYTYSFINNNQFYPLVPKEYYDFYQRFVRQWFYWYDGFVPWYHNADAGIFSTRLAYSLVSGIAELVNGGTLMFDNPNELSAFRLKYSDRDLKELDAIEFIEKWSYDVNLTNKNNTAIEYSLAGGDSCYKLNSNGKDLYPVVLRKDNYFIDTDFRGNVVGFTGLIYSYNKQTKEDEGDNRQYYYILEDRKYDDKDNPQYRIYVKRGYGNLTTHKSADLHKIQEVPFKELPKDIIKYIKKDYPSVKLGEWIDLPLKTIGIYLMKATDSISFMPQAPFGESILSNILSYLISYDYTFSSMNTDQYLGRGRVIIPQHMESPNKDNGANFNSGLDSGFYTQVPYTNLQDQKPVAIQFDTRPEKHGKTRNQLLQDIAMSLKISQRTIASFLEDGAEKATAREVSVDDKTSIFVENKRTLYRKPINLMLQDVLDFYNFPDEIGVRFSKVGLVNTNDLVQQNTTLMQNGLIDRYTALSNIHVDKNKRQVEEMLENIEKAEEEKRIQENVQDTVQDEGTSDEDYEQQNNTDINHLEKPKE